MRLETVSTARRRFGRARPWLICIDLQREYVVPGRPHYAAGSGPVALACERVLRHARSRGWRVVHTQLRQDEGFFAAAGRFGAPIEGLRPLITEPVFMRTGLSAFSNPDFAGELRDAVGEVVYLIGFSMNHTCMATALAGVDLGISLTLVEDAIGAAPCAGVGPRRAGDIAEAILAPFVDFTTSADLARAVLELVP